MVPLSFLITLSAAFVGALLPALYYFLKKEQKDPTILSFPAIFTSFIFLLGTLTTLIQGIHYVGSWFLFDSLTTLMNVVVGVLFFTAMLASVSFIRHEWKTGHSTPGHIALYYICAHLFALALILALTANNPFFLWIALESSTLATVLLVAYSGKKTSLEAAWKYMILCSAGLLIGLVGLLVLFFAPGVAANGERVPFLLSSLSVSGLLWNSIILKIAFIFLFIGFGTKVGFAPLHTWLPDAHGETPAPISGMLSGVLLSVAFIALLRFKGIVDSGLGGSEWTNRLFLIFGLSSVIYAAFLLLRQQNIKRMLAHSSIEHMGIAAFAAALGPIGIAAALLHLVGHALLKSLLFFASGELYMKAKSPLISDMRGIMASDKRTTVLFFFGLLGLLAVPPSALFMSEIAIVSSGIATQTTIFPVAAFLVGILIASFAMMKHATQFLDARQHTEVVVAVERRVHPEIQETWNLTHTAMLSEFLILIGLSVFAATVNGQNFFMGLAELITHSV